MRNPMNIMKKSTLIIVFTAFLASHYTHAMNTQSQEAAIIGGVILEEIPLGVLLCENISPNDMFLINIAVSDDPEEAGKAVNALSKVNRDLNNLMNDPGYNRALIKHFAKKFNMRERYVCLILQTEAAKLYYVNARDIFGSTPLMDELYRIGERRDKRAPSFEQILETPSLLINLQDSSGNTALMYLLSFIRVHQHNPENFALLKDRLIKLLNTGADPEMGNNKGETPAQIAENMENEEIIKIIDRAITRKHLSV